MDTAEVILCNLPCAPTSKMLATYLKQGQVQRVTLYLQLKANHVTHSLRGDTRQHSYLQWQGARRTTTISLTRLTLFFTILSAA